MSTESQIASIARPAGVVTADDETGRALLDAAQHAAGVNGRSGVATLWNGATLVWHEAASEPGTPRFGVALVSDASIEAVANAAAASCGLAADAIRTQLEGAAAKPWSDTARLTSFFASVVEHVATTVEDSLSFDAATEAVDQAYEMIDLLHGLGSVVGDPTRQQDLVSQAADDIRETLGFGWVLVALDEDRAPGVGLPEPMMFSLAAGIEGERVLECLQARDEFAAWPEAGGVRTWEEDERDLLGTFGVVEPLRVDGTAVGVVIAGGKLPGAPEVSSFDQRMLQSVASYIGPMMRVAELFEAQQRLFFGTVQALTGTVDAKDPYTRGHSERVAHLGSLLAEALGWDANQVERVRLAGMLHDIGKIGVPERVLRKAGRLTDEEFDEIKKHPGIGHKILQGVPGLDDVLPGVLSHHERWDGRGYPQNLAGDDIPLIARVLGLADTFDAMSSNRAYRPGMDRANVLAEITKCGGSQFDPELAPVFVGLDFAEYDQLVARAATQEAYREAA